MALDKIGFYYPKVDQEKCIDCNLCYNKCPVINHPEKKEYKEGFWASYSYDTDLVLSSSSGGVFGEISKSIMSSSGIVYGVKWDKKKWLPLHDRIDKLEMLHTLYGSKYVQSYIGDTYQSIKKDLVNDRIVLFSGTPCQVAAVNNFVENQNLYTIDVVCHGVPSITVFKKYLEYKFDNEEIKAINFRYKSPDWKNFSINIEFKKRRYYTKEFNFDDFCYGFLNNMYLNSLCYNCPFSKMPRQGDITLGDYWGVPNSINSKIGVSAVLTNTQKGENLFRNNENLKIIPQTIENLTRNNVRITQGSYTKYKKREELLYHILSSDFKFIKERYIKTPKNRYTYSIRLGINKMKRTIKREL